MLTRRTSGVLLPVFSLPGAHGIGDLGPEAHAFVDWLVRARQGLWQVLPLNPTTAARHHSPYEAASAFAGNPLLVSPDFLREQGWLHEHDVPAAAHAGGVPQRLDYTRVTAYKEACLRAAERRFREQAEPDSFLRFREEQAAWLDDYVLFAALKAAAPDRAWWEWPAALRDRETAALAEARREYADEIRRHLFFQYAFDRQWRRLKRYANERGVRIVGDIPFYVGQDCADVWAHAAAFKLGGDRRPLAVAGVPPDYFSPTGQLWGNPVYDWAHMAGTGFDWWIRRLRHNFAMYDVVRIDHFRGFAAHWEVPAGSATAAAGRWVPGPGARFFRDVFRLFPFAPIVAEDLGTITPEVRELIREFALPGMAVLLFAFDGDLATNPYAPHNHLPNSVLYTGTHDNNTLRGWFDEEAGGYQKERLFEYLGRHVPAAEIHRELIRLAMMSVSRAVILPIQDVLGLGSEARVNRPATLEGNWEWRLRHEQLAAADAQHLAALTRLYGRD